MREPQTFSELLADWPTLQLSADLGVSYVTARKMRERESVGIAHWPKLIETARRKGFKLSYDRLVAMRTSKTEGAAA